MNATLTKRELKALKRKIFSVFAEACFHQNYPGEKYIPNWHIEVMASALYDCFTGKKKRLIINIPPRSLKSLLASVALPAFWLGHRPSTKIICASYGQDFSETLARQFRNIVTSPWYSELFPTTKLSKVSAAEIETTEGGYRYATSPGGPATGLGADVLIIDDPQKPGDVLSEVHRLGVQDWYRHTLYSRLNSKIDGCVIVIMQRLHEDDLTGYLLQQEGWTIVKLPAIAEEEEVHRHESLFTTVTHRRRPGELLQPERESAESLAQTRVILGEYNYAGQYQQSPAPKDGGIIKEPWIRRCLTKEMPERYDRVEQSWDTANKPSELSDYSVCLTFGICKNRYYLINVYRQRVDYPSLKRAMVEQAKMFSPDRILIEDKASGTQILQELREEGLSCVEGIRPHGEKIMRLRDQSGAFAAGLVCIPSDAHWAAEYVHELTTFPASKYDDQVDATSQFLKSTREWSSWTGMIAFYKDQSEEAQQARAPEGLLRVLIQEGTTHVYCIDGRAILVGPDRIVEVDRQTAQGLEQAGHTILR